MLDTFTITIIFIILSTAIAAFMRRRSRDECLNDFSHDMVTVEEISGKVSSGTLCVENTGFELRYSAKQQDESGILEASYILYKHEYPNLQAIIRYHDELSEQGKKERERELKRTYHPTFLKRLQRKVQNMFKTVRDSVMEVVNVLINRAKGVSFAGNILSTQDKYVSQIKQELLNSVRASFEPLLEKYIGHRVVLFLFRGDTFVKHVGVLKEYTADFIEIIDVDYVILDEDKLRKADLVVLRKYGIVRHSGE